MIFDRIEAYANSDDVTIVWRTNQLIPECRGFALERDSRGDGEPPLRSFVPTWVGFKGEKHKPHESRPSTIWPIQRYIWTDYLAHFGQELRYRAIPMIRVNGSLDKAPEDQWSDWTSWVKIGTAKSAEFSAYFNRGIVPAQWLAELQGKNGKRLLGEDIRQKGSKNREFLGGELRREMLDLLNHAIEDGVEIHAALYELNDPELIDALKSIGPRCFLILASGAYKAADKRHNKAAVPDENENVREDLRQHSKIDVIDRLVKSPHFAHNKFVVFSDNEGKPRKVWTGSTNWTVTGLCTQTNNGLLIESDKIAEDYLHRWNELKAAGDGYPADLAEAGSTPGRDTLQNAEVTVWNTPTLGFVDLADARKRIHAAKQGILFLMLNPGRTDSLLDDILALDKNKLLIHGVLNQDPGGKEDPKITLVHKGEKFTPVSLPAVLPRALQAAGQNWFKTEFTFNMIMIHSKVIVIDPFGKRPVVMTGSHNLGQKASAKNDDNLVIIEDAPGLAQEYAVNVLGIYGHYKWRYNQYVNKEGTKKEKNLSPQYDGNFDNDLWQGRYTSGPNLKEINFWLGE